MSLENLEAQIDEVRANAERLGTQHYAREREIDADANLSDEGKTLAKQQSRDTTRPLIRELRHREEALIDAAIEQRQKVIESVAGNGTDIIAFRDAQDRADRVESAEEAQRLIERALRQGDTSLAHALLRVGIEKNYRGVIAAFTAKRPDIAETIRDLQELEDIKSNGFARTVPYAIL